eukprot:scaffold153828_cov39-Prasinocladus_malaysianus.AAC.1
MAFEHAPIHSVPAYINSRALESVLAQRTGSRRGEIHLSSILWLSGGEANHNQLIFWDVNCQICHSYAAVFEEGHLKAATRTVPRRREGQVLVRHHKFPRYLTVANARNAAGDIICRACIVCLILPVLALGPLPAVAGPGLFVVVDDCVAVCWLALAEASVQIGVLGRPF